jgi:hypothetical protein
MSDDVVFAFEQDFAGSLRCIPMSVRLKLDLCGVKLSLRQWSRFTADDRRRLLAQVCENHPAVVTFRDDLVTLVRSRTGEAAVSLVVEPHAPWDDPDRLPERLTERTSSLGLASPSLEQWAALTRLQRYALCKLIRPGHDNDNLEPALREFGLLAVTS